MAFHWDRQRSLHRPADTQDPRQDWILRPWPAGDERAARSDREVLAFMFRFASPEAMRTFASDFGGDGPHDPPARPQDRDIVVFPTMTRDQLGEGPVRIVGFARYGLMETIRAALDKLDGENGFFSTGVPIQGDVAFAPFPPPPASDRRRGPIHVVIDTEIAFANARFLDLAGGTRIEQFWDMGATRIDPSGPVVLGRYLDASRIDCLRKAFAQGGNVDEWALYAKYDAAAHGPGSRQRLPAASGHGTHVLDLFTGGPSPDDGLGIPIVAVALPQWAVDTTHGLFLFPFVKMVFDWIRTWPSGAPQVNFSFGGIAGPHDGQGALERLFDQAIADDVVTAVNIPAGNSFDSATHASLSAADLAVPQTLEWNIQPDDGTESYLQIWLPECRTDKHDPNIRLTLTTPFGLAETFCDNQAEFADLLRDGEVPARVYLLCQAAPYGAPVRAFFLIVVRHTAPHRSRFGLSRGCPDLAGAWKVTLSAAHLKPRQRIELWIERDDELARAHTGARQSTFTAPDPVWPDPPPDDPKVTNAGTISDIATGAGTIVAAGYVRALRQPSSYSSEGFATPFRHPPTAAAIADDSRIHRGVLASGTFSGSVTAMAGTSAASAIAARVVAGIARDGIDPTRNAVKAVAKVQDPRPFPETAPIDPVFGTYPDNLPPRSRVGWGCLETRWTRLPRFIPRT